MLKSLLKSWKFYAVLAMIALGWLAFAHLDLYQFWQISKNVNWYFLVFVVILNFLVVLLKAYRWKVILQGVPPLKVLRAGQAEKLTPQELPMVLASASTATEDATAAPLAATPPVVLKVSLWQTFLATCIGFMAKTFLPGVGGDVVRIMVLKVEEKLSKVTVFGTLITDRIVEGLALLTLIGVLTTVSYMMPEWLRTGIYSLFYLLLLFLVLIGLLLLTFRKMGGVDKFHKLYAASAKETLPPDQGKESFIMRLLPKSFKVEVSKIFTRICIGLIPLLHLGRFIYVFVVSLVIWFLQILMIYLCFMALGVTLSTIDALFVLVVINLVLLVPLTPNNVGTFELAAVMALTYLGVSKAAALSIALLYHFVQIIPTTLVGLMLLPFLKLNLRQIRSIAALNQDMAVMRTPASKSSKD